MNPYGPNISIALPPTTGPSTDPHSKTITRIAVAPASSEAEYLSPSMVKAQIKILLDPPPQIIRNKIQI